MLGRNLFATFSLLGLLATAACSQSSSPEPATLNPPLITKVTRENYLSGKQFCKTYSELTSKEFGKYITVPMDYARPEMGSLEIYAYTNKKFNPNLPTYIFVDGGPGQNTHGEMPDYLGDKYNELRFDQRGLGCSAPNDYETYMNADLYSSNNNIRDMELVRQGFGIKSWSVYGLSYGTVPATMYGSKYPDVTRSVVLEGVFGDAKKVHLMSYKLSKINLVYMDLAAKQKESFAKLLYEESEDNEFMMKLIWQLFYSDTGMRILKTSLNILIEKDGTIRRDIFQNARMKMKASEEKYSLPQQPGAVDSNILTKIYCRDLDSRNRIKEDIHFNSTTGFYSTPKEGDDSDAKDCDEAGVSAAQATPYKISDYPVTVPVYYFQGSHDGATMAIGAIDHWKKVPQGKSYFMLAQKGGHNPNLERLSSRSLARKYAERKLLQASVDGIEINQTMIEIANQDMEAGQEWKLYLSPGKDMLDGDLEGIQFRLSPEPML